MQNRPRRPQFSSHPEGSSANVTSAIGMEETVGHQRARRNSLFTQTVIWITGLVCLAFLVGTFAQAWSNSHLVQQVQDAQQGLQQKSDQHTHLQQMADTYKDPSVIESEARQQLGYVHPGEQSVVVVGTDKQGQQKSASQLHVSSQQGYWQEWWQVFFGH